VAHMNMPMGEPEPDTMASSRPSGLICRRPCCPKELPVMEGAEANKALAASRPWAWGAPELFTTSR